jgi:hypothetical protein
VACELHVNAEVRMATVQEGEGVEQAPSSAPCTI